MQLGSLFLNSDLRIQF